MSPRAACSALAEVEDVLASDCLCGCSPSNTEISGYLDDASDILYYLSGGQIFGECEATVRPCRSCWCGGCTGCCDIDYVPLRTPVIEVSEVKIDGVVLDPATYAVTPRGFLYRLSSGARPEAWPDNQSLWRADTEDNTFSITYAFGQASPQPTWIVQAAVELVCEMANHFNNKNTKLPPNATAAFAQGVSISLQTKAEAIAQAATYLPAVANFIALTGRGNQAAGIWSPDPVSAWSFPLS